MLLLLGQGRAAFEYGSVPFENCSGIQHFTMKSQDKGMAIAL